MWYVTYDMDFIKFYLEKRIILNISNKSKRIIFIFIQVYNVLNVIVPNQRSQDWKKTIKSL